MCAERNASAPIIIKKKKIVVGGGHHGGAWKVAYADFVTAMMAFFMLMWLLNATTEKQRKGIADYFSPTIPVSRVSGGGAGMFGGDSITAEQALAENGHASDKALPLTAAARTAADQAPAADTTPFDEEARRIEEQLLAQAGESMASESAARHIVTRVTDEGLIVEIFDLPGEPLFVEDSDQPTPLTRDLAMAIARAFGLAANGVATNGHVRTYPSVLIANPVWALSADRAMTMRILLEEGGLPPARLHRVSGHADRKPATANPMEPRNNRIELILLRRTE